MTKAPWIAALWAIAGLAAAQDGPQGIPLSDDVPRDAEFGVSARHFGLERRVEMLQWRVDGAGYAKAWNEQPVDSTGFASGHANPEFPLRGRRWIADAITVDGKPLDPEVIARLGEWRRFRPNFSALPGNLAATFQPEGDGLGSAENPLDPQIGDLRIHWRELVLPPLADRIVLRSGRWVLARESEDADPVDAQPAHEPRRSWLVPAGIAALLLTLGWWLHRRRRR